MTGFETFLDHRCNDRCPAKAAPGKGARLYEAPGGRKVLVAQALGQVFMSRPYDNPFSALDGVSAAIDQSDRA